VPVDSVELSKMGPVGLDKREGVFVHSFKCGNCKLEFVLFSWVANRHRVGETMCPECGRRRPMVHWRAIVSESPTFDPEAQNEIFRLHPWPSSRVMDDTTA
jgi:DNA-directed RNA polymerase subunit RPC12/RpoP